MWDQRSHLPVRYVYDPFVAGDTIDFDARRGLLLIGSYSEQDFLRVCMHVRVSCLRSCLLQIYNFETLELVAKLSAQSPFHVYACQVDNQPPM